MRNAQTVQELVLAIDQTSSAAITNNPGEREADRFKRQLSTMVNSSDRSQALEKNCQFTFSCD